MLDQPTVNVITIASKLDDALFVTLDNVSQQSYQAIEHIVVYRQASETAIARLQNFNHQKHLVFYPETGQGIASAFNDGINYSQGELVLFLNAGDALVERDVVERVVQSYQGQKWLWATGETISVSRNRLLKKYLKQRASWNQNLFWYGNPVCHQSTFYTRQLIKQVGLYNESLAIGMDYDYNVRANVVASPTLLYFPIAYYDTTGVSSIRVFKQLRNYRRIRDRYFQLSTFNRFKVDTYCLLKSMVRLAMIPAKLWL